MIVRVAVVAVVIVVTAAVVIVVEGAEIDPKTIKPSPLTVEASHPLPKQHPFFKPKNLGGQNHAFNAQKNQVPEVTPWQPGW